MTTSIKLNDGSSIPWIAFGTGTALYGSDASSFVRSAIANGVTHLDGAQMYNNEDSLGAGIKESGAPRSSLYVVTKLNSLKEGESVRESLVASLKKLDLDYVDLFLIHVPHTWEGRLKSIWKEFEGLKKEGLAKSIGVSNFTVSHLNEILEDATIVPAVNQIEYHPYLFKQAEPIVQFCKEKGIVVASYGGLTSISRAAGGPVDAPLETVRARLEKTRGSPVSAGQVLGKLLNQQGVVVVTTTSKSERIKEYLDALKVPDLTAEEFKTICEAGAQKEVRTWWAEEIKW